MDPKTCLYAWYIFDYLNIKLQGQQTHSLQFKDAVIGFLSNVQNWHRIVYTAVGNIELHVFPNLSLSQAISHVDLHVDSAAHLKSLEVEVELKDYYESGFGILVKLKAKARYNLSVADRKMSLGFLQEFQL